MFDSRKQFAQDQLGQKFSNERQLADYAALTAKDEQQFRDYQQKTEMLYDRKSQVLEAAKARISQQMEFDNRVINQTKDQLSKKKMSEQEKAALQKILQEKLDLRQVLRNKAAEVQAALDRAKARKANTKAKNIATGAVVGAVVGGVIGSFIPGAGTAAGASVGASAGGAIGSQM